MKKGVTRRRPAMTRFAPPIPSTKTKQKQERHPLGSLPADILAEMLPRLPYRSLCRFKCVSKPWMALCSDPDIRKRSSQTLSGFFFNDGGRFSFRNLSGRGQPLVDPSLPFLRGSYDRFDVQRCCGGLLLCRCWKSRDEEDEYDHVVCNPMTGQWTVLPPIPPQDEDGVVSGYIAPMDMFLGSVPSRFTVFAPLTNCEDNEFTEMAIYSSKTGRWITAVETDPTTLAPNSGCVFLNGTMHFVTKCGSIVTVDTEGVDWGEINMPKDMSRSRRSKVSIGQSRGRLHAWQIIDNNDDYDDDYDNYDGDDGDGDGDDDDDDDNDDYGDAHLYVWVLKDYNRGKWILKHDAPVSEMFGRERGEDDFSYTAFAIHPHSNCIFLTDKEEMAVSYDMGNQKVSVICSSKEFSKDILPYVPCFAEWSSDGH